MTTFKKIREAGDRMPERHSLLESNAFADDWRDKPPGGELLLGLRRYSDGDAQTARAEAARFAASMHEEIDREGQVEAFNDALMRWLVVRGTCDANDITLNAPLFDGSEENVRNALTSKAIRFLWDEIERYHLEVSPVVPEATDEEMLKLGELLKQPSLLEDMSPGSQKRFRKLAGFLLSEMNNVMVTVTEV